MDLSFRRAAPEDVPAAQAAYRQIIDHLARTADFPHWHTEDHPRPAQVAAWIAAGELYLAHTPDDTGSASPAEIAGVVVLNHATAGGYDDADWAIDAAPEEVLVVHVLGVTPDHLGQGVARFLIDSSLQAAREQGCRTLRLDAYVENLPARTLYARHGFTDLGVHTLDYDGTDLEQFHLFEQVL
ncbi:GNAT family N-acetyltransferase [Brachybacterium vulturis]|uniref:GNAT family N-acetyltransferase n=1 Tax=Brachybacterium vulturis TaxID=2017484 RepID=A0A291GKZ0_9MICO|nr:GNAT family N-acetyltransferase [Brachybacterium vulturis]ATG51183.1 GNAT family N-acetyltransferase [Brachybacterium vulturis]